MSRRHSSMYPSARSIGVDAELVGAGDDLVVHVGEVLDVLDL